MTDLEGIKSTTKSFRDQKDELYIGIGRELVKKGIDIQKIVIADIFTEDVNMYYVVIVTRDKGVFEFYYDYFHNKMSEGKIVEWHDFTENPEKAYMHASVMIALKHIKDL